MKQTTSRLRAALCLVAIGGALLGGCSEDSTGPDDNNNGGDQTVAPKVGSTYTYSRQNQDKDGNPVGSQTTRTDTLVSASLSVGARSGVYGFANGTDTMYYHYESNGDISVNVKTNFFRLAGDEWHDFPFITEWFTVPFVSKSSKNDTLAHVQNYGAGSVKVPMTVNAVSEHAGTEMVTVNGEILTAQKVETTINVVIGSLLNRVKVKWSFIPKIGYFSTYDFIISPTEFLGPSNIYKGGSVSTLTSYELK